jgi:hypothetical protein
MDTATGGEGGAAFSNAENLGLKILNPRFTGVSRKLGVTQAIS